MSSTGMEGGLCSRSKYRANVAHDGAGDRAGGADAVVEHEHGDRPDGAAW